MIMDPDNKMYSRFWFAANIIEKCRFSPILEYPFRVKHLVFAHIWRMNSRWALLLVTLAGIGLVLACYFPMFSNPNGHLFSSEGDGLKNYYTYAYHIKNDSTVSEMEGMNFPYGENFLYTDSHPILSSSFQALNQTFPSISEYSVAILNVLMLLSVVLTFPLLYILLKKFKIDSWLAIIFAIAIGLLAPQVFRLQGHLALSYSVAIPMSWIFYIHFKESNKKWLWLIVLFLNALFWLFIHAYLGVMIVFFLVLLSLLEKKWLAVISLILPIIVFFAVLKITDIHTNRNTDALGFFLYNAELDDVFLPNSGPVKNVIQNTFSVQLHQQWEAFSYVGFGFALLAVFVVVYSLKSKLFGDRVWPAFFENKSLNKALLAAIFVLLFAMGLPFKWMPSLLDYLNPVKAFRATGRFAWIFFFVFSVFSVFVLQKVLNSTSQKVRNVALIIAACIGLIHMIEGFQTHQNIGSVISSQSNLFNRNILSDEYKNGLNAIEKKNYKTMIALPFFHGSSEAFSRPLFTEIFEHAVVISYHSGLPMMNANLTRMDMTESKNVIQILSPDYYTKPIRSKLNNDDLVIILCSTEPITKYEQALKNKSKIVYSGEHFDLLEITWGEIFESSANIELERYMSRDQNDHGLYSNAYWQNEIQYGNKKGDWVINQISSGTLKAGEAYTASVWIGNKHQGDLNNHYRLIAEEFSSNGTLLKSTEILAEQSQVIDGDWSLLECGFGVLDSNSSVKILLRGKAEDDHNVIIRDFLIYQNGVNFYRMNDDNDILFFNNQAIPLR